MNRPSSNGDDAATWASGDRGEASPLPRRPIAIVGMSCRFPGAASVAAFWQMLRDGVDAIREVPPERYDMQGFYDPTPGKPGKIYSRWGGFVDDIDLFDPYFFGISPREADRMDPQQRMLLEVAWEALEDAGIVPENLKGSRSGVFVGLCYDEYGLLQFYHSDPAEIDIYTSTGSARSVTSGRISYALGLQGPSLTVDTACSSSLVATHLACQSIWSGESDVALACGTNLLLKPHANIPFAQAKMLAQDGRCKAFDARADGFVRSDGVGVVVLKPLAQAQADGDTIHAVIRGSASNNDGRSGDGLLMMPSYEGQEEVVREAFRVAGVAPSSVQYVEAHGTGTSVGDPIEARALSAVLCEDRPKGEPIRLGSVKTNIGHTEGAAGVAGLIKAVLALKHKTVPPSLHLTQPNPNIPWEDLNLAVQTEAEGWPKAEGPARASVSSFGISGSNAHVVLEEAPPLPKSLHTNGHRAGEDTVYLLPLSAHTAEALDARAESLRDFISTPEAPSIEDLCYTAALRRASLDHRLAVTGQTPEELADRLSAFLKGDVQPGIAAGRRAKEGAQKLVFVFPGQGSQWLGMGRELLETEPVFREAIEACDAAFQPFADWSLLDELLADEAHSQLDRVDVIQPMIFAMQVALSALWRSWGVEPDAVIGQSLGEVAASCVAGALSLEDAARVICLRSKLVRQAASGQGAMLVVGLSLAAAKAVIVGKEEEISIGVSTSPTSTVLSGDVQALEALVAELETQEVFCRFVNVDYASHSPQMEPLRADLLALLAPVTPHAAPVPIYSTVSTEPTDGSRFDADYWWHNIREPVLFLDTLERLVEDEHSLFIEVSPHPVVQSSVQQNLRHFGKEGVVVPSLRREEEERPVMLGALGGLFCAGYEVDWQRLYPTGRNVPLPTYPWQRERFWRDELDAGATPWLTAHSSGTLSQHPLLGHRLTSAAHAGTHFWEKALGPATIGYLGEHLIQGLPVLPAAAYLEMALGAAREVLGDGPHTLEDVRLEQALFLPADGTKTVQMVLTPQQTGRAAFKLFSHRPGEGGLPDAWTLHASGVIRRGAAEAQPKSFEPSELAQRCDEEISREGHYTTMEAQGVKYGPAFMGIDEIRRQPGEALGRLHLPEPVAHEAGNYGIHPALLDACFQVLASVRPVGGDAFEEGELYLPVGLGRMHRHGDPTVACFGYATLRVVEGRDHALEGDAFLLDEDGAVVLEARGLRVQRVEGRTGGAQDLDEWVYELAWKPQPLEAAPNFKAAPGRWLLFVDEHGVAGRLGDRLEALGNTCTLVTPGMAFEKTGAEAYVIDPARAEDYGRLISEVFAGEKKVEGVVHSWSLGREVDLSEQSVESAQEQGSLSVIHLVRALVREGQWGKNLAGVRQNGEAALLPPRLWLISRGVHVIEEGDAPRAPEHAPLWGVGRVVTVENPELPCMLVDLGAAEETEIGALIEEFGGGSLESQLAFRQGRRYVARLSSYRLPKAAVVPRPARPEEGFRLEIGTPGLLDSLTLRAVERPALVPGEVEIEVRAAALNFSDVMKAMGIYPGATAETPLGVECSGVVTRVAHDVTHVAVGDEVMAIAEWSFGSYTIASHKYMVKKPASLSFEEAATVPIAFLTAYYALVYLGRMREGERVLIHSASGGVGLAAVQLARRAGAEIFATAGTEEKRDFLRSLGIEYVFDSRSLDFAEEIERITEGTGVDLVLNSLPGEALVRSLGLVGRYGRFLEIGKRDIYENSQIGLSPFKNNIAFFSIDLDRFLRDREEEAKALLREFAAFFDEGSLQPIRNEVFSLIDVEHAFRKMAQAKHLGKLVVAVPEDKSSVEIVPASDEASLYHAGATYLITGGLGGLGLLTARWLVDQGARHLVLLGRSAPKQEARAALDEMEALGATVLVASADVTSIDSLRAVFEEVVEKMPPLRGIIHAAGVLDDGILLQMPSEQFLKVLRPKMTGTWNLHALSLDQPLDFFVLFSSGASVLGSAGQANYVAANAFQDAFAFYRKDQGLPALAINWGYWAGVGMVAREDRAQRLEQRGVLHFAPKEGLAMMDRLIRHGHPQLGVMPVDWAQLRRFHPAAAEVPLLSEVMAQYAADMGAAKGGVVRDEILAAPAEERQGRVEDFLLQQIGRVLGLSESRLARLDVHQPLNTLGLDSLMAVELKNRVELELGVTMPVATLLQGPSLRAFAAELLAQMPVTTAAEEVEEVTNLLEQIEDLSDEEVEALLAERGEL